MSKKTESNNRPAPKKPSTQKTSQAKCSEKVKSVGPVIASAVEIEISVRMTGNRKKIIYLSQGNQISGDVDVITNRGANEGSLSFFSTSGPIVISLYPEQVCGEKSVFMFEARNAGSNNPIKITIPKGGRKGDTYKYSVALFDGTDVVSADPRIRIAD